VERNHERSGTAKSVADELVQDNFIVVALEDDNDSVELEEISAADPEYLGPAALWELHGAGVSAAVDPSEDLDEVGVGIAENIAGVGRRDDPKGVLLGVGGQCVCGVSFGERVKTSFWLIEQVDRGVRASAAIALAKRGR
jgi:hypothetical protein